jgi:excisionase family DNA binding protein
MYLTVEQTAEYLELPVAYVESLIQHNKIRTVHDGQQYMINKEQFNHHLEQMKKLKQQIQEEQQEPIPEDVDVKDED